MDKDWLRVTGDVVVPYIYIHALYHLNAALPIGWLSRNRGGWEGLCAVLLQARCAHAINHTAIYCALLVLAGVQACSHPWSCVRPPQGSWVPMGITSLSSTQHSRPAVPCLPNAGLIQLAPATASVCSCARLHYMWCITCGDWCRAPCTDHYCPQGRRAAQHGDCQFQFKETYVVTGTGHAAGLVVSVATARETNTSVLPSPPVPAQAAVQGALAAQHQAPLLLRPPELPLLPSQCAAKCKC